MYEPASRAAFTVHTGGSIDDEHGGWANLFTLRSRVGGVRRPRGNDVSTER
jgi:hypothetical protein